MNKKYIPLLITLLLFINIFCISNFTAMSAFAQTKLKDKDSIPYIGVNVRGYYTSIQGLRYSMQFPDHYYDRSFKLISEGGMNHIRYVFYWEAYERNPTLFIEEIKKVSKLADKWGLKVIYDSHQYHTSSWLDPKNGTGFPPELFQNNPETPHGAGGTTVDNAAKIWWGKWWDRNVTDTSGKDGWGLYASFLKNIIRLVDNHKSTLGYEILNEPQIHSSDQWEKVGKYNSYMTDQLREVTEKTIVYSMNVPISFKIHSLALSADNLAKMAPEHKENIVFKISVYGIPLPNTYQGEKLNILTEAGKLARVPMYIGEWNEVSREEKINENGNMISQIDPASSNLDQVKANDLIHEFKKIGIWGMAFWNWNYISHPAPNFNLIKVKEDGHIQTTKYFKIVEKAISS